MVITLHPRVEMKEENQKKKNVVEGNGGEIHFFLITESQIFEGKKNLDIMKYPKHLFQYLESKGFSYNDQEKKNKTPVIYVPLCSK